MITEIAVLNIKKGLSISFEKNFLLAQEIIKMMPGFISHELLKNIEIEDKYLLTVSWQKIENHKDGFRKSKEYLEWKSLLHHFYDPFPTVEYYKKIV